MAASSESLSKQKGKEWIYKRLSIAWNCALSGVVGLFLEMR
jgi:hypothetical protein